MDKLRKKSKTSPKSSISFQLVMFFSLLVISLGVFANTLNQSEEDNRPDWLKSMATAICNEFSFGDDLIDGVNTIIRVNIKEQNGLIDPKPDQIAMFWNEHIEDLTCDVAGKQAHVMHLAFDRDIAFQYLFKDYLDKKIQRKLTNRSIKINVNFVIEEQTVLDFVDSEIARFEALAAEQGDEYYRDTINKMKRIRKLLIRRFDAKHFRELPKQ